MPRHSDPTVQLDRRHYPPTVKVTQAWFAYRQAHRAWAASEAPTVEFPAVPRVATAVLPVVSA